MRMIKQRHFFRSAFAAFILSLVITATVTSRAAAGEDGIDPMGQVTSALGAVSDATGGVLNLSGYFNAHVMNHDGLPTFLNSRNLNKDFWQLREFSLFADMNVYEGIVVSSELELGDSFNSTTINYLYTQITFSDLLSN